MCFLDRLQNKEKNMNTTTQRYYWSKLHSDFFERDDIKIIKGMPNGCEYILFYLNLICKSINHNGKLMFKDTTPYTLDMLSIITSTNIDVVRRALELFTRLGLIQELGDGALFISETNKMLGSETEYAQKKREYRQKQASKQLSDKSKTIKDIVQDNVRQEIDIEKEIEKDNPLNPPKVTDNNSEGVGVDWLNCISEHKYQFTPEQVTAITEWVKYKSNKNEAFTKQQIELTLKQLNNHNLAKQNIVYMIERSISMGYKAIMEPTMSSMSTVAKIPISRYPAAEYITPENQEQKTQLRNYLERSYEGKLDPRTKEPLTEEQMVLINKHLKYRRKSLHLSITDYISKHEVSTGVCLLDQPIDD